MRTPLPGAHKSSRASIHDFSVFLFEGKPSESRPQVAFFCSRVLLADVTIDENESADAVNDEVARSEVATTLKPALRNP